MELDVCYKVSKDNAWEYINCNVHRSSIDLVIYRPCFDLFICKKTIRNAAGRLAPGGIFCIQADPEISSHVIDVINSMNMQYSIVHEYCNNPDTGPYIKLWILAHNEELQNIQRLIKISSVKKAGIIMIPYSDYGDTIMCIGNESIIHAIESKRHGRHVIVFADDEIQGLKLHFEGVRGVDVP